MRKTYFILILLMGFLSLSAQTDSTQVTVSTHVTKAEADSAISIMILPMLQSYMKVF